MTIGRPPIPQAFAPHDALILAIDPGKAAGAAIIDSGRPGITVVLAEAVKPGDEADIVDLAMTRARAEGRVLMVVREKWQAGGHRMTPSMLAGLGAAWGRWEAALLASGYPLSRVVRVYPSTWKARTIGAPRGDKSQASKTRAKYFAERLLGKPLESHDAADAVCIGVWASRAVEVGEKIPKRRTTR